MTEILLIVIIVLVVINIAIVLFKKLKIDIKSQLKDVENSMIKFDATLDRTDKAIKDEFQRNRTETNVIAKSNREELSKSLDTFSNQLSVNLKELNELLKGKYEETYNQQSEFNKQIIDGNKTNRDELRISLKSFEDKFTDNIKELNELVRQKFNDYSKQQTDLNKQTTDNVKEIKDSVETQLKSIREDNTKQLDEMRKTVDEKLQKTLDERLSESFKLVSDRLEQVHKGLGEMQTLASGVGDLKKVLSNVRTRGSLGEYRLEMILEQILAPEQYQKAVATKPGSRENVEFAINIPSKDSENEFLLLPIDSKFPQEKYQAVLDSYDKVDPIIIQESLKELEKTVKGLAKDISEKYINPPITTDFAIMFLPFEGLYAEVVKRPSLFETLQKDYKITIVGPSTCAAFLHSLQMGFRTLAIQKRSSEVWDLLRAVKTEFGRFATILEGVEKNLNTASNKIQDASRKSRTIERKLKGVESLPQSSTANLLGSDFDIDESIEQQNENTE